MTCVPCIFVGLASVCKLIETTNASSCLTVAQFHLEPVCSYNSRSNRIFVTETIFHLIGLTRRMISRTAAESSAGFCLQSFCINGNNFFTNGNNKLSSFALQSVYFMTVKRFYLLKYWSYDKKYLIFNFQHWHKNLVYKKVIFYIISFNLIIFKIIIIFNTLIII